MATMATTAMPSPAGARGGHTGPALAQVGGWAGRPCGLCLCAGGMRGRGEVVRGRQAQRAALQCDGQQPALWSVVQGRIPAAHLALARAEMLLRGQLDCSPLHAPLHARLLPGIVYLESYIYSNLTVLVPWL